MRETKKLLHVLYSGQGGLGTYFMNFVNSDKENRFEHFAFFYGIEPLLDEYRLFCEERGIVYCYAERTGKVDFLALFKLKRFGLKNDVNYLFLHTFSLTLIHFVAPLKFKVIAVDHTNNSVKTGIEKLYTVFNHLVSYRMIYFYQGHFNELMKIFPFLWKGKRSLIIPKSVDVVFFSPDQEYNITRKIFTLGMVGRIVPGKRYCLLAEAIKSLLGKGVEVKLKIAGDGPDKGELERYVSELGLQSKVEFTGRLNQQELLTFYKGLDAYIHATDGETICYCIMEAQACGLPILASNVKGVNNVLTNESALLFDNSVASIEESIRTLVIKRELRLKLRAKSRAMSEINSRNNNPSQKLLEVL